jgi:hypothetical protein
MLCIFRGEERTFPGYSGPPRKARRRGRDLPNNDEGPPLRAGDRDELRRPAAELRRDAPEIAFDTAGVEEAEPADGHEGQTPFEGNRRSGEGTRHRSSVHLATVTGRMVLGAGADHLHVRERRSLLLEERALLPGRLQQDEREVRPGRREREPR